MAKDLLLEIGMEEIPARFIRASVEQLADKTAKWLNDSRLAYESVNMYATPRRIAVLINGIAEKQEDINEEAKGPSKKIALDDNSNWTKAALGFARSQGVEPEQLFFKEIGGVEYVHAVKNSIGVETAGLLADGLAAIIHSLSFPKNMRWGSCDMKFARPIRWLVALFGEEVVPLAVAGVSAGRITKGHRFLGAEVQIDRPFAYVEQLKKQFVFADIVEREAIIRNQLDQLAAEKGWNIPIKEDLLEEVLFLVEYPTVLFGTFNPEFLDIPQDVLITSMREHQRYFPVLDQAGKLLPYFVTVRNGNAVSLDQVAKGNEKVLRARLSDARFFYQEDQKQPIEKSLSKLETVVFHEELGTVGDKVRRIGAISKALTEALQLDAETGKLIARAAAICKFDLVTQMVYEFPELQGVMGEDYARKLGEPEAVARAVFEHYQPRFSGESAPAFVVGAIVSIADKLDTISGCFSIGIIPTGSQDPYALRRQAAGIVSILLEHKLAVKLGDLFDIALQVHEAARPLKRERNEIRKDLNDFFLLRVKNVLGDKEIRYDVTDAVTTAGIDDVSGVVRRAEAVTSAVKEADFKLTVDSFNRVCNLAAKAESFTIAPELFAEAAERELYEAWKAAHTALEQKLASGSEAEALAVLTTLRAPITSFFDAVMVMAEDAAVRSNRLALLHGIAGDIKAVADFSKLVW